MIVILIGGTLLGIRMSSLETLGAILAIIGYGHSSWQSYRNRFRGVAAGAGDTALLDHLRTELTRQRDFHRVGLGWRLLLDVSGPFVFFAGFTLAHREVLFGGGSLPTLEVQLIRLIIVALVVRTIVAIPLNHRLARRYQVQIDQLERASER